MVGNWAVKIAQFFWFQLMNDLDICLLLERVKIRI